MTGAVSSAIGNPEWSERSIEGEYYYAEKNVSFFNNGHVELLYKWNERDSSG